MASVPSTLVLFTQDKVNFPPKDVLIFTKTLFRYGVKNISLKGDKVFIQLSYSPRAETLKKKFQQLPLKYMRLKIDNMDDFKVVERVVRMYGYNFVEEDADDVHRMISRSNTRMIELPIIEKDDDDDATTTNEQQQEDGEDDDEADEQH